MANSELGQMLSFESMNGGRPVGPPETNSRYDPRTGEFLTNQGQAPQAPQQQAPQQGLLSREMLSGAAPQQAGEAPGQAVSYGGYQLPDSLPPVRGRAPRGILGLLGAQAPVDENATAEQGARYGMFREDARRAEAARGVKEKGAATELGLRSGQDSSVGPWEGSGVVNIGAVAKRLAEDKSLPASERLRILDDMSRYATDHEREQYQRWRTDRGFTERVDARAEQGGQHDRALADRAEARDLARERLQLGKDKLAAPAKVQPRAARPVPAAAPGGPGAAPAAVAEVPAVNPTPRIAPPAAIEALRANPQRANEFDAMFGAGAAARALGR